MISLLSQQAGHGFGFRNQTLMFFPYYVHNGYPKYGTACLDGKADPDFLSLGMAIKPFSCKMFIF